MLHASTYNLLHTETKMDAIKSLQLFKYCGCSHLRLLEAQYLWIPHLPWAFAVSTVLSSVLSCSLVD